MAQAASPVTSKRWHEHDPPRIPRHNHDELGEHSHYPDWIIYFNGTTATAVVDRPTPDITDGPVPP